MVEQHAGVPMTQVIFAQCRPGTLAQPCLFMWEARGWRWRKGPGRRREREAREGVWARSSKMVGNKKTLKRNQKENG